MLERGAGRGDSELADLRSGHGEEGHIDENLTARDIQTIARARSTSRVQGTVTRKRSIVRQAPIKHRARERSTEEQDSEAKRSMLLEHLEAVQRLPKNSAYARHRKLTLEHALALLDRSRWPSG
jgi:hypothetical protein